jgi:hypothetical protein
MLRVILGLLAWALLALLFFIPPAAHAEALEARADNGNTITLYDDAGVCAAGALRAEFTNASSTVRIGGCWMIDSAAMVRIVFFDVDALMVPAALFKPVKKT